MGGEPERLLAFGRAVTTDGPSELLLTSFKLEELKDWQLTIRDAPADTVGTVELGTAKKFVASPVLEALLETTGEMCS